MNIEGKVALVTGGAVRVGKAITLMLAQAGAHVVVNYHGSAEAAQETAAEARALGVEALPIQCDVADAGAVQTMARQVSDRWGGVDILVNSAGYFGKTPVPTDDLDTWRRVTRISIDGAFFVANALPPPCSAAARAPSSTSWTCWHGRRGGALRRMPWAKPGCWPSRIS